MALGIGRFCALLVRGWVLFRVGNSERSGSKRLFLNLLAGGTCRVCVVQNVPKAPCQLTPQSLNPAGRQCESIVSRLPYTSPVTQ